jgi:hypothetical protein
VCATRPSCSRVFSRLGFDALLAEQKALARQRAIRWRLVACGGRNAALEAFADAVRRASSSELVVLLVDAEEPSSEETSTNHVQHIAKNAGWSLDEGLLQNVHLMTACMETGLVADSEVLARYYGQGFNTNALPERTILDEEPKESLAKALKAATHNTQKGTYNKLKHGTELLQKVRPAKISARCRSFKTFAEWLASEIAH